jgi:sugar phosphate isomerase/epimerase
VLPAYCTNVVAGRTLEESCTNVERTFGAVASALRTGSLPLGLWLSALGARQLAESVAGAAGLRERLAASGLQVATLNGFPYHDFHDAEVKHRVYEPHWADARRAMHTELLATLLAELVPPGTARASISTLPLGWRARFSSEGCGASVGLASAFLDQLVRALARIEDATGVRVTVDLEPEPGCMLDRAADAVGFFEHALARRPGGPDPRRYLGICHDVCHAAVMFEEQREVLRAYRAAGIPVNKVQVSRAVVADGGADSLAVLAGFDEPRWLHQTCVRSRDGRVRFFEDLPLALASGADGEWRTHFHVPVDAARLGALGTTQGAILECLDDLSSWPEAERPCVELETYAWDALPGGMRGAAPLADRIASEISWLAGAMRERGLAGGGVRS